MTMMPPPSLSLSLSLSCYHSLSLSLHPPPPLCSPPHPLSLKLQAFQSVRDKSQAARDLLSLAGLLTDSLLQGMASKPERLALTAQLPPSQLEWVRKQVRLDKQTC